MQELVLAQAGQSVDGSASNEEARVSRHRELDQLLAENAPLAFRVAVGVLRNRTEAEDVAQEALFRAYRRFDLLRDPRRFRAWLVRISFRLALDRWRSERRREQRDTQWARPELRPAAPSVEEIAASREFHARLERAMDELPKRLRLVVLLAGIEGHTMTEVAGLLGVSPGTVKSRLFKARKCLAEKLR